MIAISFFSPNKQVDLNYINAQARYTNRSYGRKIDVSGSIKDKTFQDNFS